MAKDSVILEFQLKAEGGDKVVSEVKDISTAFDSAKKSADAVFSEKAVGSATENLKKFNTEAEKTGQKFLAAKTELQQLTKAINSGQLSGKELQEATKRAAELTDKIGDVRNEIKRLSSDTKVFDTLVEGARGVAAAMSIAQGATALFGDENQDLQKSILKVQGALALLSGAQEVANILTTKGGIATQAYGVAIKVVEGIQKAFAISSAAAWAVATGGIAILVAAVGGLIYWMKQDSDATDEAAQSTVSFADAITTTTREVEKLKVELQKAKGIISGFEADKLKLAQERANALADLDAEFARKQGDIDKDENLTQVQRTEEFFRLLREKRIEREKLNEKYDLLEKTNAQNHHNELIADAKKFAEEQSKLAHKDVVAVNVPTMEDFQDFIDTIKNVKDDINEEPLITDGTVEATKKNADDLANSIAFSANEVSAEWKTAREEAAKETQAFLGLAQSLASSLNSITNSFLESQLTTIKGNNEQQQIELERQKQNELRLVGDNAQKRQFIEERFAKEKEKLNKKMAIEEAKIKREQAIANKISALINVAVNTASAIVKAVEASPLTGGLPFSAIAAAIGAAETIAILAQPLPPIPKFAEGVIRYKGKGTDTSDDNIVRISNNESVIAAQPSKKYEDELRAINDMEFENLLLHKYLLPALQANKANASADSQYDDFLLRKTIRNQAEQDKQNAKFIVDGITRTIREQDYFTKRYYS